MKTLNAMFGMYLKQPIHRTLNDLRAISVVCIGLSWLMLWDIWGFLKESGDLSENQFATGVIGLAVTMITTIWKAINHIQDKISKDDNCRGTDLVDRREGEG